MKPCVQLVQVNYAYGSNVFLPYSAGMLQAYALSQPDLASGYEFLTPLFLRRPVAEVVVSLPPLKVLGFSCYIWNWEYCKALGAAIKAAQPDCFVVLGGTQVPHDFKGFAASHPWADALVFYEGEKVFAGLLRELLSPSPRLDQVPGLILLYDNEEHVTAPAGRIQDLAELPSPYLTGIFDSILRTHPALSFQASQETHRGCPYTCTFCDWGSATMNKVRQFSTERVTSEYQWFASHGIDLLYNCDANYGLFERDVELTQALVECKQQHGLPAKFRAAYAKNSNQRVFEIARLLNIEGMCKGVTLSFQSIDAHTLGLIKRKNMAVNNFAELMKLYRDASIPTYTELILGLPGETYDSFANGINTMLEAGQHEGLNIYHAMLLPNSEMSKPAYLEQHGIKSVRTELLLLHGTREPGDIPEFYDIVVETATMPQRDWLRASLFAYVVQAFHCLNLTQEIAHNAYAQGISYREFYERLIDWTLGLPSTGELGAELAHVLSKLERVITHQDSLDMQDRSFGDLMWPVEEILFLRLLRSRPAWLNDLARFIKFRLQLDGDFITRQVNSTRHPDFEPRQLDWPTFAREVVWYGRKGGSMRRKVKA